MTVDVKTNCIRSHFYGQIDITIHAAFSKVEVAQSREKEISHTDIPSQILFRITSAVVGIFMHFSNIGLELYSQPPLNLTDSFV